MCYRHFIIKEVGAIGLVLFLVLGNFILENGTISDIIEMLMSCQNDAWNSTSTGFSCWSVHYLRTIALS